MLPGRPSSLAATLRSPSPRHSADDSHLAVVRPDHGLRLRMRQVRRTADLGSAGIVSLGDLNPNVSEGGLETARLYPQWLTGTVADRLTSTFTKAWRSGELPGRLHGTSCHSVRRRQSVQLASSTLLSMERLWRLRGSAYCPAGMAPDQIAEVRPRLLAFAGEMLGGLARSDQRAAGELYVRGLLTDGRRKPMVAMAERLGVDHQRLQQFITSSAWDYAVVRRNVARWFASSQPVEALVVDDTGFPKDGTASPCVARQYSGTLGQGRQLPDRGQRAPGERACVLRRGLAAVLPGVLGRHHAR